MKLNINRSYRYDKDTLQLTEVINPQDESYRDLQDNNQVENVIRSVAVNRKNWLFAGSSVVSQRAAAIMSLLVTARMTGINPHQLLHNVLMRLPQ
ncbi:TPA: IS66 family transposase [Salmonella enterica]|uniref:IS66 family transposase n=2 Tax=Salmonella enterica TaxID=28901 RepID=A0A758BI02_SALER|nr:hypothetical protein [Salmonella enterica subsp. enterica serovar Koketime]EAM8931351.1 hypothetical protein [Salmonella enterica]EHG8447782.1 IS66 family transposase [Salmonella enterica subsp. enterica]EBB4439815.1 IS66 family transposase [Salmonella enterica]EBR9056133.1 hypothetical protein [Salmonella enterica subsp. enterica serovar Koketime]